MSGKLIYCLNVSLDGYIADRDGVIVAFHDDDLDRLTGGRGTIGDLPYDEVRHALVRGREQIPLLEDLLTTFPDARINIDPKHDAAAQHRINVAQPAGQSRLVAAHNFVHAFGFDGHAAGRSTAGQIRHDYFFLQTVPFAAARAAAGPRRTHRPAIAANIPHRRFLRHISSQFTI